MSHNISSNVTSNSVQIVAKQKKKYVKIWITMSILYFWMKLALSNSLQIACIVFNVYKSMHSFCKHIFPLINMSKTIRPEADLVGVCRGAHRPPPPFPSWDDLRLSNTTGILQNMKICMIFILSSSHCIIRDLKQRRKQRQKKNWFYEQNNCSARASRFLVHFFDFYCTTTTWKPPNATFCGGRGHTTTHFPFSIWTWTKNSTPGNWSRLYLNNWVVPNRRDKVWKDPNSFFLLMFSLPSS